MDLNAAVQTVLSLSDFGVAHVFKTGGGPTDPWEVDPGSHTLSATNVLDAELEGAAWLLSNSGLKVISNWVDTGDPEAGAHAIYV